jgi:glycyl-tRNA synthetase alpha subunit
MASIYKIFEYTELDNPSEITRSKFTIIENMMGDSKKPVIEEMNSIYKEPKEIRLLSYKIMVEKFNSKYGELSKEQKAVLREYISNVSNTNNLKLFLQTESKKIKSILEQKVKKVADKTMKIKLTEVISLLDSYQTIKTVDENHVSALMRYYDLINDL